MRRTRALVGGVLFWVSCAAGPTVPSVAPGQEFALEVGLSAVVSGTGLRVGFERVVSDSRCPADAICITAGEAVVAFTVVRSGRPADALTLHTEGEGRRAVVGDWTLRLTRLEPYPSGGQAIPARGYRATLRVDPLSQSAGS